MFYLQLLLPLNDLLATNSSAEPGVVNTPESQETSSSSELPFIPGDAILLSTYPDTTSFLNGIYAIDDEGYVEFPIGDRIRISPMAEEDFLKFLKDKYQNYVRSPNLSVKAMIRVTVVGGFVTPGLYYVDKKLSFWDLIRMAGGPNHEGAIKEIHWERNGEPMVEDLTPYLESGTSLKTMGVRSGDLVWTPSPDYETPLRFVITNILPLLTFATSLVFLYISYQTFILVARGR
jgi:protein involved in polysaccharide export with SLBB domain